MAEPDLSLLTPAELKAFEARERWIIQATEPPRTGKQLVPRFGDWDQLLFRSGRGFGKDLALDTPLATPSGWTTMGAISVGDKVFDEKGRSCTVTAKFSPPQTTVYRVSFSDGSHIDAGADHQWVTFTHRDRKQMQRYADVRAFPDDWPKWRGKLLNSWNNAVGFYGPMIRTTEEIRATVTIGKRGDSNHCIPCALPLDLPDAPLPVDPWTLGYWLGNRTVGQSTISSGSYKGDFDGDHVCAALAAAGYETSRRDFPKKGQSRITPHLLCVSLRAIGVLHSKHVPSRYLRGSERQRLALLRGLMDSDGCAEAAKVEFCSMDRCLALAVRELAQTLGERAAWYEGAAMLGGKNCGTKYRVVWTPAVHNPFSLPRKAARVNPTASQGVRLRHRMIQSVEPIDAVPTACITVDSPNSMYLAGEAMVPTHNTSALVQWQWFECFRVPGIIGHAVAPTLSDMKGTLFEGPAGFRSVIPPEILKGGSWDSAYDVQDREISFANGSLIRGFGATDGGARLRGPQCHCAIGDELREWDTPPGALEQAHSNLMFGLRLPYPDGTPSRAVFGTTPKAIPYLKNLYKDPRVKVITGSSYENIGNLAPAFRNLLLAKEGTQIGRVEINAEDISDDEGGIFQRSWFRLWPPTKQLPEFQHILMSLDTALEEEHFDPKKKEPDYSACGVFGVFNTAQCFTEAERKAMKVKSKYAAVLCDFWMERLGFPELLERSRETYRIKYGKPGRKPDQVLIENKTSGISLRQTLMQYGVPTWPYDPRGQSKTARGHAASPLVLQGMLFVPESSRPERKGLVRDWAEPMVDQMCTFKGEGSIEYDDAYDVACQAMLRLMEAGFFHAEPQGRAYPDPDEKEEMDQRRAAEQYAKEKAGRTSWYGV